MMLSFTVVRFVLTTCLVICLLGASSVDARKRKYKFCKIDNLLECFSEPIAYFTSQANGTGIAANDEEFEQYCFNNHDYLPYCVKSWMRRCGAEMHVEIAKRVFIEPWQQSIKEFCDSKGTIRSKFLEHSPCLISKVKLAPEYRAKCVRDMQANSEHVHELMAKSPNLTNFVRGFCCSYNEWENCIVGFLRERCGEEATKSIPYLINHTTMYLLEGVCNPNVFDPTDPKKCPPELYIAPKNKVPLGYKSQSMISHYFSYLCPNVGYGIIPSKDVITNNI